MHETSGRWKLGFILALSTALIWGFLPISLKFLLGYVDVYTMTWFRFLLAAACLFVFLLFRGGLPRFHQVSGNYYALFGLAIVALCINYLCYMLGLEVLSPTATQVAIQIAPILFSLGGLIIFKERFSGGQWFGFAAVIVGLILFFHNNLSALYDGVFTQAWGLVFMLTSAVSWAIYALAQKQLLLKFSSLQILLVIFVFDCLLFLPASDLGSIAVLGSLGWFYLLFCGFATLVAYSCFAEALVHLEASRVSAVIAMVPLFTLISMQIMEHLFYGFIEAESFTWISLVGAATVVLGSLMVSVLNNASPRDEASVDS
ncbi:MAG: DMT family transporter [Pseudomonadales bacterium]|nr:DMT family transporter [Pseudomonadales bacterium]